jgi:disulfide bond formation protein DsbB
MSANRIVYLAGAYSLAMILGTQFFQYVVGVPPCEMCYWQRWPLEAAIVICFGGAGLFAAGIIGRQAVVAIAWTALILIAASGIIGAWQAGVEWQIFPGPTSCTGKRFEFHGAADLANYKPVVRCDVVAWKLFGISLAGYNTVFSLGAAGLGAYLLAFKKTFLLKKRKQ